MAKFEIIVGSVLGASEYVADALQEMLSNGEKFSTSIINNHLDCGIPETLLSTNKALLKKNFIHSTSRVENSELSNVTIMENCTIIDTELDNVIILPGATLNNCKFKDRIIGYNSKFENINHPSTKKGLLYE